MSYLHAQGEGIMEHMIFSFWTKYHFIVFIFIVVVFLLKQNEENKKKNKRAALKAQLDLEEARKEASQAADRQKNNNASWQKQEGKICLKSEK